MAFQVSPGVQVKEIDVTNVVPAVSSSIGGYAGMFSWGPIDEVRTIISEKQLVEIFGEPQDSNTSREHFYSVATFLKYANAIKVVRALNSSSLNATSGGSSGLLIKNKTHYTESFEDGSGTVGDWGARWAGSLGNSLKVSMCAGNTAFSESNVTTLDADPALGATSLGVAAAEKFVVGDRITVAGDTNKYAVTAIAFDSGSSGAGDITIHLASDKTKGLQVDVASGINVSREWEFATYFDTAPGTSPNATDKGASNDELHVVVVDEDGDITGQVGEILETFSNVSKATDAKDSFGASNYYKNVVRDQSNYLWWLDHNSNLTTVGVTLQNAGTGRTFSTYSLPVTNSLSNGADGEQPTSAQKNTGYSTYLGDAETVDVDFLIAGPNSADNGSGTEVATVAEATTHINNLITIAESRKDCVVVCSPRRADVVNNVGSEQSSVTTLADTLTSSSYAVMDSNWLYMYDKYNDQYCYVPACGSTAGLMARTDLVRDAWYSPAGFNRGQYLGVTKLAFNPNQAERDELYKKRVNPVVTFPGEGTILFGDKTLLSNPSAFDRINVRRLFIVLEKAISTAAKFQLFEFNDAFTRANFRATVEPFLRAVQGRRGIVDFQVICDETNNPQAVVDANQFQASIFVKPNKSINFITLNFVAARSGVEFEEVYGATNTLAGS